MRRFVPFLIAGVALIATACGDAIAPTRSETPSNALTRVGASHSAARDAFVPSFATRQEISIPAAGGVVRVGGFTLFFPPQSVCDPTTSGYGTGTWDRECKTLSADYRLTAAFWSENGESFVEFLDDIRFAPDRWIVLAVRSSADAPDIQYFRRDALGGVAKTDEGATDLSMRTYYSSWTRQAYRRIKHFSGYVVPSGRCDETSDPNCVPEGGQ